MQGVEEQTGIGNGVQCGTDNQTTRTSQGREDSALQGQHRFGCNRMTSAYTTLGVAGLVL